MVLAALAQSFGVSLLAVVLVSLLAWPAARVLGRWDSPWAVFWEVILLLPAVLPVVTTLWGNHLWMSALYLTDSWVATVIMLSYYASPYLLRTLIVGYRLFSWEKIETARNLGAGPWRTFFRIEVPLLASAWTAGASIVFLVAWSDYLVTTVFGGGLVKTLSTWVMPLLASSDRVTVGPLVALLSFVPLILVLGGTHWIEKNHRRS